VNSTARKKKTLVAAGGYQDLLVYLCGTEGDVLLSFLWYSASVPSVGEGKVFLGEDSEPY